MFRGKRASLWLGLLGGRKALESTPALAGFMARSFSDAYPPASDTNLLPGHHRCSIFEGYLWEWNIIRQRLSWRRLRTLPGNYQNICLCVSYKLNNFLLVPVGTSEEENFIEGKNDMIFKCQYPLIMFYWSIAPPICSNTINDYYHKDSHDGPRKFKNLYY